MMLFLMKTLDKIKFLIMFQNKLINIYILFNLCKKNHQNQSDCQVIQEQILLIDDDLTNTNQNMYQYMKQVISLNIGQGGVQVGNSCWQLFCLEHHIDPYGYMNHFDSDAFRTFYSQSKEGNYVPRAIYIDLEPTAIDEIRTGTFRNLYAPENLLSGKEDTANNFARGRYTAGKQNIQICLDRIRKEVEKCVNFQGFIIFNALGGGTGSGMGTHLMERLDFDYCKKTNIGFNIYPSPHTSTSCVEPYNSILATHGLFEHQDVSVVLDNNALYDICTRNLDIERPTFTNINRIIAQVTSSLTASLRFGGSLYVDLNEFQTSLVPYPRTHFIISSYSPIVNIDKTYLERLSMPQMTNQLFKPANMMAKCDPRLGKFLTCSIYYKGDIVLNEVDPAICDIYTKRTISFVDWCPTGFKRSINYKPPVAVPGSDMAAVSRSCCMIGNSTSIKSVFDRLNHKFDLMYAKKAFVHWYKRQGMEEAEFLEARENLAALEKDYEDMQAEQGAEGQQG